MEGAAVRILSHHKAIVTGAESGIGAACALALAEAGASVTIDGGLSLVLGQGA